MPESTTIHPHAATEPGALDGWAIDCTCGARWTSSLATLADQEAAEHLRWHRRQEAEQVVAEAARQRAEAGRVSDAAEDCLRRAEQQGELGPLGDESVPDPIEIDVHSQSATLSTTLPSGRRATVDVFYFERFGQPTVPEVNWSALGSVSAEDAAAYADLLAAAAAYAATWTPSEPICGACGQLLDPDEEHVCDLDDREAT